MRLSILAFVTVGLASTVPLRAQSYVPNRVFDTDRGRFSDFEAMAAALARADVVFLGEQHDDPNTHRLELAVLEALARRNRAVMLSLEMFERDVQEPLGRFVAGHTEEAEFLKGARPWPRYATDYKPLVDFAIAKDWPVVAANVPRALASQVSKGGLQILQTTPGMDRGFFARDLECPVGDRYFARFVEAMGGHPGAGAAAADAKETNRRFYEAQCLKDETMAESIAMAYGGAPSGQRPVIVHVNGAFHSDYGQGTAARVKRRLPKAAIAVVSIKPVADLDKAEPSKDDRKLGRFILYTTRTAAPVATTFRGPSPPPRRP